MNRIIFFLLAWLCTITLQAQSIKILKGDSVVDSFTPEEADRVIITESMSDYVEVGDLLWATKNLGATSVAGSPSACYGDYYAWSEVAPRYTGMHITNSQQATFDGWAESHLYGYSANDCPSYSANAICAENDAATQVWGNVGYEWRMPTAEEFHLLAQACTGSMLSQTVTPLSTATPAGGIYWLESNQQLLSEYAGVAGVLFVLNDDTTKRIFFPAAGYVDGKEFGNGGVYGCYWTANRNTALPGDAFYMLLSSSNLNPSNSDPLYEGYSIRPVATKFQLVQ